MSVDIERLIVEAGHVPSSYVTTPRWFGAVSLAAADAREVGLLVGYSPLDDNPFHGEVWGDFSRPVQRHIQSACVWFVEIAGVSIE
jgi:hypothetical protein